MSANPQPGVRDRARRSLKRLADLAFTASNQLRLPGPTVLPVAGAVVGIYSGLAAGIFANLIGIVSGLCLGLSRVIDVFTPKSGTAQLLRKTLAETDWHTEYAVFGLPIAFAALAVARSIQPGGPRDLVKQRLRVLALLVIGALGLYYPLEGLTALNIVFGRSRDVPAALEHFPWWAMLAAPMVGGLIVGHLLRNRPETHGHGIPEVLLAIKGRTDLPAEGGVMKLIASAVTIGSGGSAGREGPVVYGGAAFGSAVGKTLGFSRRELAILLACGAGGGIAASFDSPIGGAVFAMEIILREFELKSFSPIILASVTATLVGRGTMGDIRFLEHVSYSVQSGWEMLAYAGLGLVCGLVSFAFVRLLHHSEDFFQGRFPGKLSPLIGGRPLAVRAGIGGLLAGAMALASPAVWGLGQEYINLAAAEQLAFGFLALACVLKLLATVVTIGSGGSGGTFTPATVIGAVAGGAFGSALHAVFPHHTASSGSYALVGMGGMIAGFTRGPLTGMMMMYELSGNTQIIVALMITCILSSIVCHALVERKGPKERSDEDLLRETVARVLVYPATPVARDLGLKPLVDLLIAAEDGTLPVLDANGRIYGVVQIDALRDVWRDEHLHAALVASDLARPVATLSADEDLASALERMDEEDVDALPVVDMVKSAQPYGVLTRTAIRRYLFQQQHRAAPGEHTPVAPTEIAG